MPVFAKFMFYESFIQIHKYKITHLLIGNEYREKPMKYLLFRKEIKLLESYDEPSLITVFLHHPQGISTAQIPLTISQYLSLSNIILGESS